MLAPLGPTYTLGCTAQRNGLQPFSFLHLFLAVPKGVGFKKNDTLRSRKNRGELPTGGWSESFDLGLWTQWSHFICEVKTLASGCVLLTSRKPAHGRTAESAAGRLGKVIVLGRLVVDGGDPAVA